MVVVGEREFRVRAEDVLGLVGDDADGARDRVAAEQRTLRAFHDLRALDVVHGGHDAARAARPDAVDEHRDRGVAADAEVVGRDAAHRERVGEAVLGLAAEARREVDDAADVGHAAFLQHVAGEGGDRERHVLERLLALLRGDDDFVEADDLWRGCGLARAGCSCASAASGQDKRGSDSHDGPPPGSGSSCLRPPHRPIGQHAFPATRIRRDRGFSPRPSIIGARVSKIRSTSARSMMSGGDMAIVSPVVRIRRPRLEGRDQRVVAARARRARARLRARCRRPGRRRAGRRRCVGPSARARHRSSTAPSRAPARTARRAVDLLRREAGRAGDRVRASTCSRGTARSRPAGPDMKAS